MAEEAITIALSLALSRRERARERGLLVAGL
jgi:hypothetical protein